MAYQNNKISELIEDQLPNFLQEEGPKFVKFIEKYYEFMESSKLEVSVDGVLSLDFSQDVKIRATRQIDESQDVKHVYAQVLNSYLLDNGNYVFYIKENYEQIQILNVSSPEGTFNIGDDVTQSQSNGEKTVSGKVLHVSVIDGDIDKILVLNNSTGVFVKTDALNLDLEVGPNSTAIVSIDKPDSTSTRGFLSGDQINVISGDDGSTGDITVVSYIQNATISSKNLMNLQDIDRTLDDYVDYFMKEYLEGFPLSFPNEFQSTDIDVPEFKKFLVKHSREFYQSKGTEDSFKYFFRTIFNDSVSIKYPKDEILKPSDNTFSRTKTILLNPHQLTVPNIESQKIVGETSGVSAYVEKILGIKVGEYSLFQIELNEYGLSGSFLEGENIVLESDPLTIIGTINFGASEVSIYDVEESFELEDIFYIDRSGSIVEYQDIPNIDKGALIELSVCDINAGRISEIEVVNGGVGYSVGDKLTFNNQGCFTELGPTRPISAVVSEIDTSVFEPVVVNGDFATHDASGWTLNGTGYAAQAYPITIQIGFSLITFVRLEAPQTGYWARMYQSLSYDFESGKKYKLKFYVRNWFGGSYPYGKLRYGAWPKDETIFSDSTASSIVEENIENIISPTHITLEFTANESIINSGGVTIFISYGGKGWNYLNQSGYVDIDGVELLDFNNNTLTLDPTGPIKNVEVICDGKGYIKHPTITKIGNTDITSESFNLIGKDVGTLKQVRIRKSGVRYNREKIEHYLEDWTSTESTLILKKTEIGVELPYLTLTIQNQSGDFTVGEIVNHQTLDGTGKVVSWDSVSGELVLREYSGIFSSAGEDIIEGVDSTQTGTVGVASYDSTKFKVGNGSDVWGDLEYNSGNWNDSILIQPYSIDLDLNSSGTDDIRLSLGSIFDDGGRFLNNNSFLSDIKYIQDSFYYQTYSYVLETSLMVKKYRDLLKRLIHPAGMQMFGKISSQSKKEVKMSLSEIKSNISVIIWDYIGKHSDKLIRDFDYLYSLLILDGDDSAPFDLEIQMSNTINGDFEVGEKVYNFSKEILGFSLTQGGSNTNTLQGSGTSYTTDLEVGSLIRLYHPLNNQYGDPDTPTVFVVTDIISDTELTFFPTYTGVPWTTISGTLLTTEAEATVKSWDSVNQILTLEDINGNFVLTTDIIQEFDTSQTYTQDFAVKSTIVSETELSFIEETLDASDSGVLIPDIYYHGSYACDYLYNQNTHQNYRYKIKYKNLRPGTLKQNDFYEWNKLTGTVSIPYDSYTITGVGTTFTSLSEGDIIAINGQQFSIASITNDLELIVNTCSEEEVLQGDNIQLLKRVLI